ncbi:MAG: hypothetical protein OXN96_15245 [Bryobacterales bacterium]|nr:hypothetical protein [Bryobacterales bacterium]MDE0295060.1 hypothetical protein [Bryobacterales bacterium]
MSLLPDRLALYLPGTLADVEAAVRRVGYAPTRSRCPRRCAGVRLRVRRVRAFVEARITLYPDP